MLKATKKNLISMPNSTPLDKTSFHFRKYHQDQTSTLSLFKTNYLQLTYNSYNSTSLRLKKVQSNILFLYRTPLRGGGSKTSHQKL